MCNFGLRDYSIYFANSTRFRQCSRSGTLWKNVLRGNCEVLLFPTVSSADSIMEFVLTWLQMNQASLESELQDI